MVILPFIKGGKSTKNWIVIRSHKRIAGMMVDLLVIVVPVLAAAFPFMLYSVESYTTTTSKHHFTRKND